MSSRSSARTVVEINLPKPGLIGVIHLSALPGSPRHDQSTESIVQQALQDAEALENAGFDAVIIENFGDVPFPADALEPGAVAALAIVTARVKRAISLPVGVNALRNDARSAMGIAAAADADFIRVNVHTGLTAADQGWIEGRAAQTLRYRRQLGTDTAIFADVHVKHAVPVSQPDIALAAEEVAYRGLADALIVTGPATGRGTDLDDLRRVKEAVPDRPVLAGSGATIETIRPILDTCDGVIVGTHIKRQARTGSPVDPKKAAAFVRAARG
ncbi:MAG: BtpA/SgcQ family protein [Planctomycetes bacterium]|nr:BtpA/SgcQ family protein [Planctomycetota bacterium]